MTSALRGATDPAACQGCGETRLVTYDPVLRRWSCAVCGWSWDWRALPRRSIATPVRDAAAESLVADVDALVRVGFSDGPR